MDLQRTLSPVDGRVVAERPLATPAMLDRVLQVAHKGFADWRRTPLSDRIAAVHRWLDAVAADADAAADELTWQMGRPRSSTPGELRGFDERGRTMLRLATPALADVLPPAKEATTRFIRREPLGVVLVLAPWNYPWLTAVNTIVPALAAGNTVVLKHSDQTPLVAERMSAAARAAGLPDGVFQHVHMSHDLTAAAVRDPRVAFVAFTGSVAGGEAVHRTAGGTFKGVGLELGGKDPAYVRSDAELDRAADGVVDGAFFNSGQSCCAVERVFVHDDLYDRFVDAVVDRVKAYRLGDPTEESTNLGPVVRIRNAESIRAQVQAALAGGARSLVDPSHFPEASRGLPYLAPTVLVDVDDRMAVMAEETFGPVIALDRVASDDEAIARMNASAYGLTASLWSTDLATAEALGDRLDTGTVFLNACDVLDPELAWVGVKH